MISALKTFGKGTSCKSTKIVNQPVHVSTLKNIRASSAGKKRPIKTMNGEKCITRSRSLKKARTSENSDSGCKEEESAAQDYIADCVITINQ